MQLSLSLWPVVVVLLAYRTNVGYGSNDTVESESKNPPDNYFSILASSWSKGVIPWQFSTLHPVNHEEAVRLAIAEYEDRTCLTFPEIGTPAASDENITKRVIFRDKDLGCYAYMGQSPTNNIVNLNNCDSYSAVVHEIGHVIGMFNQHRRFDRDFHVKVNFSGLTEYTRPNFMKIKYDVSKIYTPYDISSNMHDKFEDLTYFHPVDGMLRDIVLLPSLSHYDFMAINAHYKCASTCSSPPVCENDGYVDRDCLCACPAYLSGPTCNTLAVGFQSAAGCGGVYKVMKIGEGFTFSAPSTSPLTSKNCTWIFTSDPVTAIDVTFSNWSMESYGSYIEVRYVLPGQRGVVYEATNMDPTFVIPTFKATSNGDYNRRPYLLVTVNPDRSPGQPAVSLTGTVKVTADTSMLDPNLHTDGDDAFVDFHSKWSSSLALQSAILDKSSGQTVLKLTGRTGQTSWLETKVMWDGTKSVCMSFTYKLSDAAFTLLIIQTVHRDGTTKPQINLHDKAETWTTKKVTLSESAPFKVKLSFGPLTTDKSVLYLDDILIHTCGENIKLSEPQLSDAAANLYTNSFETSADLTEKCKVSGSASGSLLRSKYRTQTTLTGPSVASEGKYFVYFEASLGKPGDTAELTLKWIGDGSREICLMFDYHSYGRNTGSLIVHTVDRGDSSRKKLFEVTRENLDFWKKKLIRIPAQTGKPYSLLFEIVRGLRFDGDIGLDNIKVGSCNANAFSTSEPLFTVVWDFEGASPFDALIPGGNMKKQPNKHTYRLITGKKSEWSYRYYGAPGAHGGYYYILMDAIQGPKGSTAEITTMNVFDGMYEGKIVLYLCMRGKNMGGFFIFVTDSKNDTNRKLIYERKYVTRPWDLTEVVIPQQRTSYRITFRSVRGGGFSSDIAVDDIVIYSRKPSTRSDPVIVPPKNRTTVMPTAYVPPNPPPIETDMFEQSFETDMYGFFTGGDRTFLRISGATPTKGTGPKRAADGQYYVYFESSPSSPKDEAFLICEAIYKGDTDICVEFDYHIFGQSTGELRVLTIEGPKGGATKQTVVWSEKSQSENWRVGNANITARQSKEYRVGFQVIHPGGTRGDIALDNILIGKGPCQRVTVGTDCKACYDDHKPVNKTCFPDHLDGQPYCSAYGTWGKASWLKEVCKVEPSVVNGKPIYRKSCLLSTCSVGYNSTSIEDMTLKTISFKTTCKDKNGKDCMICCPKHCDLNAGNSHLLSLFYTFITCYISASYYF